MSPNQTHQVPAEGHSHARGPVVDEESFASVPAVTHTLSITEDTQLTLGPHDFTSQYVQQDTSHNELPGDNPQGVHTYSASDLTDPMTFALNHMDLPDTSVNHHFQEHPQETHPYGNSNVPSQGTPTVDHHQESTQGTYQFLTRLWEHRKNNSGHATTDAMSWSTMERWENETFHEQPWHGVDSVYIVDTDMEQDRGQADGAQDKSEYQTEDANSMACEGSSEMWWA